MMLLRRIKNIEEQQFPLTVRLMGALKKRDASVIRPATDSQRELLIEEKMNVKCSLFVRFLGKVIFSNFERSLFFFLSLFFLSSPLFAAVLTGVNSPDTSTLMSSPFICLTMIVKNEAAIIERCLKSVLPVVDCFCICDTGSTDNTVALIQNFMKEHQVAGQIYQHEWKNFGHNRTLSAECAKKTVKALGLPLDATYLLLLDADMQLEVEDNFTKAKLQEDAYLLIQRNGNLSYGNIRLIKAHLPWRCVGVTHEYWSCSRQIKQELLEDLAIDDCNDGGCKADKFERDLKLLTQGLIDEPYNERYLFYLAQTYKCLNRYEESNYWYEQRCKRGGWFEEVWYSKYMMGENYEALGDFNQALKSYSEAFRLNPKRAEPLYNIAKYYRLEGQSLTSTLFAKLGLSIPYPSDQLLFISDFVYEYGLDEEMAISAYYTPMKEEGFESINRLLLNPNVPEEVKELAQKNLRFYLPKLSLEKIIDLSFTLPLIQEGKKERYLPSNPSILKKEEGYILNLRAVNYRINQEGGYAVTSDGGIVNTKNFFISLDKDFRWMHQKEIVDPTPRVLSPEVRKITGLEDLRLFYLGNSCSFFCHTLDTSPTQCCQVSFGQLGEMPGKEASSLLVKNLVPLSGSLPTFCEKNWLPLVKEDKLFAIYSFDPFTLYQIDWQNQKLELALSYTPEIEATSFRGSAPPIAFDGGYLVLVHEVLPTDRRIYVHRFVWLDENMRMVKWSKPFTFLHTGIEYCLSMSLDHSGEKLIMPFSVEDCEVKMGVLDLKTLRSMLQSESH